MQTQQFSNGSWCEYDDDAETVVVNRDFSGSSSAARRLAPQPVADAATDVDDEASPPTQRSIEVTSSGPSRPFSRTMIGSGVHNPEGERAAIVDDRAASGPKPQLAGASFVDEPSPVPWVHAEVAPAPKPAVVETPGVPVAPLPRLLAQAHRARGQVIPAAPSQPVVIRTGSPRPPPPASATPAAMAIDLPTGVRERASRDLMGGPPSVFRGRNKASAMLAAASLLITVLLGVVLLVPRSGELRIAPSIDKGRIERADVFVDGTKRCDAVPCLVRDLSRGEHGVEVRAAGYQTESRMETVDLGKERLALIPIRPVVVPAGIRASASGPGVHVVVDGVDRGALPAAVADLPPGQHRVRFVGPGVDAAEQTVVLGPGEVRDFGVVHAAPPTE
jgi:PEGA domain